MLGAGEGWAKSILFNARLRDEFAAFFARGDTFALGVCNGCQMMSNLREIIPGAAHWPHFVRNASEQFEARFVMLEVHADRRRCSSTAWRAAAFRWRWRTARATPNFAMPAQLAAAQPLVALRFVDHRGRRDRSLSVQSERLAAGHHRTDDAPTAASRS